MKILLTNDDGIHASGLSALYRELQHAHTLTVIAPDRERSAVGHAITLQKPIRINEIEIKNCFKGFSVSGTPADCIKLGVLELMVTPPDMVISGINPGANLGINANYSGTVCAAREAGIYGIPAMAFSMKGNDTARLDAAAKWVARLADRVSDIGLPKGTILNINIPDVPISETTGVRISRQEILPFETYFEQRVDPRKRTYYWQGSEQPLTPSGPDVDVAAFEKQYITITPIKTDMTDYRAIQDLKKRGIDTGNI